MLQKLSQIVGSGSTITPEGRSLNSEAINSLRQESDPELQLEGLLELGQELEQAGRDREAGEIYRLMVQGLPERNPFSERARQRVRILMGGGPLGLRLEHQARNFLDQVTDPAMLVGMGIGGLAFRGGRLLTLRGLVGSGQTGLGVRIGATLGGLTAETLAFTASAKGIRTFMGHSERWDVEALSHEWGATALVLGSLRLMGTPMAYLARGRSFAGLYHQAGMYGGIVLGHGLQAYAGFRDSQGWSALLSESLGTLVLFNAGGTLARNLFGRHLAPLEGILDQRMAQMETSGRSWVPNFALAEGPQGFSLPGIVLHNMQMNAMSSRSGNSIRVVSGGMGIRPSRSDVETPSRATMRERLKKLIPQGRILRSQLDRKGFIEEILECFNIPAHPFDRELFRSGYELARSKPERVQRIAWDVDEVLLHRSLNPLGLIRGVFRGHRKPEYQNTPPETFDYDYFKTDPSLRLGPLTGLWFGLGQRFFPSRMRQHIQFHPGMRAYLLGLRLGQNLPLIMATTGPAGRMLTIANEDPAFAQIFFGKLPGEPVSIEEVRHRPNVYTREDLVWALRTAENQVLSFPHDPLVQDYITRIQAHPDKATKLKHPAIARLLAKRPFFILVDDSASAYDMLHNVPDFAVLRPPSDRPPLFLNFVFGSTSKYLDKMSNGYAENLAGVLAQEGYLRSTRIEKTPTPEAYPHQRFTIEIPWRMFGEEFYKPGLELSRLSKKLKAFHLPEVGEYAIREGPFRPSPADRKVLTNRLALEVQTLMEGGEGRVQVHARSGRELKEQAQRNPEAFQGFLESHFHPRERIRFEESSRPVQERSQKFFSTMAGILASKDAVLDLLNFRLERPYDQIHFRYGRPVVYGEVSRRLGNGNLMTSQTSDGEAGLGLAVWEPRLYASGLASIGIDLTTPRLKRVHEKLGVTPEHHALAEAVYKATLRYHPIKRFNRYRYQEISKLEDIEDKRLLAEVHEFTYGHYLLSGRTAEAAVKWLGAGRTGVNQIVPARDFNLGGAIMGLVAIPAPREGGSARIFPDTVSSPRGEYGFADPGVLKHMAPGQRVVVLGDMSAGRTYDLAKEGHLPVIIDRDPHYFDLHQMAFRRRNEIDIKRERVDRELFAEWIFGDWFDTEVAGDTVEAYFPLSITDIPSSRPSLVQDHVANFMKEALHTKLGPRGGNVFVITEVPAVIESIQNQIKSDPTLELIDINFNDRNPPLRGGHNYHDKGDGPQDHWILYHRKGQ